MIRTMNRHRLALALAFVGALALGGAAGPALASVSTFYPTQSLGDRGTDVATLQQLLRYQQAGPPDGGDRMVVVAGRNPVVIPLDGVYGASTVEAVRNFQLLRGLPGTGIVDPATWTKLVVPLAPGSQGDAVVAVQRLLREKRSASLALDGIYATSTAAAVSTFQGHMGLTRTGAVDAMTWRALVWHFELPMFSASALCDYSAGNGPANWGTASTIAAIEVAGAKTVAAGLGRVAVGDVSLVLGGDIPGHETHERGLDADLRLIRKAHDQCTSGTSWRSSSYDRAATRVLIKAIRAVAPGHVKLIYFNDPVLIGEGLTTWSMGHDDHLHVRFCEAYHPDARYRC
jgi:peptidoglycan hydrolase-like protein with peptidoglycan-binding domain